MKRLLTILLSVFIAFSSCLMASAESYDSSASLTVSYSDEKLVFEVTGDNAEKYLSAAINGTGRISLHQNKPDFDGVITNKKEADITRDGNKLYVSKQTLLDRGYYSGDYYFDIYAGDTFVSGNNIQIDLGKELTANRIDVLRLVGEIPTPKEGESTSIDKSKLYLADANGNKVPEDEFDFYWEEQYINNDGAKSFYPMYSDTFTATETYALVVCYSYVGDRDYNGDIKLTYNGQTISRQNSNSMFGPDDNGEYAYCKSDIVACNYGKTGGGSYLRTHDGNTYLVGEFVAKSSKDVEVTAKQDTNGDLIVSASGADAKFFIDTLYETDYKIDETEYHGGIQLKHEDGFYGYINNYANDLEKVNDTTLKISKQSLVNGGFINGNYTATAYISESTEEYYKYLNVSKNTFSLNVGKTFVPNMSSKINIQVNLSAPIEGQKTEVDLSKIVVTDENGNKLPVKDSSNGQRVGYSAYWAEKYNMTRASAGYEYIPTEDETFVVGKTYYLVVNYYYFENGDDIGMGRHSITVTSNISFTNVRAVSYGGTGGTYLVTTDYASFVASFEAEGLKKEEAKMDVAKDSKVSASSLNDSAADLENKVLTKEDKELLKNGAEIKTYIAVSDKNVSESDKKAVEKTVENKLEGNTIAQILDIKLKKEITQSSTTTTQDVTNTNGKVEISFTIDDSLVNKDSGIERTYKVVRIHNGEAEILNAEFDSTTKTIKFKTDRFSTYALVYKDAKKETNNNSSNKVVTCEEAMNSKNWTWSEAKKACVYRVSKTSTK